ncbi:DUF58 domain-containing protein [Halomicrobium sp. HM KBTZ05]|uniref:DUF58 domain-containing protein n=1 Tax=Halomicrobium sp. HM KBTZ05 TaxID=3242663 RepID=UPI003557953F
MSRQSTRWRATVAAATLFAAAGLVARSGALLLAAIVPLVYLAYSLVTSGPDSVSLSVTRHVEPELSPPGTPVHVTLEVTNEGDRPVSDLRVVDAVPADLAVTRGTPRTGVALEPGATTTIEYVLVARRGVHAFEPPRVRVRSLGGTSVTTLRPTVSGDTQLVCRLDADAPPIDDQGAQFVGDLTTDEPGEGLTFHSTREYRRGDDARRIDWRTYAKTGELTTVDYERRRAASVVLVVDARRISRVSAGPGRPTAVELSAYAATHAVTDFVASGHDIGVAVIGADGPGPAGLHWLAPESGDGQRSRAIDYFRTATEVTGGAPDTDRQLAELLDLVPPGAQLALFSPLLDDLPVEAVQAWRSQGYPAVVLSPDVVTDNTVGGQFEQVQRYTRLARCQATGARATDWRRGTPLPMALAYAFAADARLPSQRPTGAGGVP